MCMSQAARDFDDFIKSLVEADYGDELRARDEEAKRQVEEAKRQGEEAFRKELKEKDQLIAQLTAELHAKG